MKYYNKPGLIELYSGILKQNQQKLLSGGTGDSFLTSSSTDERMALALVFRPSGEIAGRITAHLEQLRDMEPDLYFYPPRDLHVTVVDILKGMPGRKIPDNIEQYIQCIKECAARIRPFTVEFDGMTASDNAAMVKGFYEAELEDFRILIRRAFAEKSLPLEERYQTISSHITTTRIPIKLQNPKAFIDYIMEPVSFGTMKTDSLELVFHNWYDSKKTVLAKFPLC